ncbi:MAG TPA: GMP synthase, partial [Polyangiaceae bacterium]|nr:GMP synthase [Polyangiaceae bacterium]
MRPLVIVVTGDPVSAVLSTRGGFADLIRARASAFPGGFRVIDARSEPLPPLGETSGLIVTGSAASVTEPTPWMRATADYLAQAVRAQAMVLGICFGHQLLAEALGGRVVKNPRGREMGTISADVLEQDPLLSERRPFTVNTTHVDTVAELPAGARVLARTELEPH